MRCACYDSRPVVSILPCLSSAARVAPSWGSVEGPRGGFCSALWAALPYLPTYLPTWLPTHLLPSDLLPTYLPPTTYLPTYRRTPSTYLPTYLGAGEFLIEGSLGAGLVLAARPTGETTRYSKWFGETKKRERERETTEHSPTRAQPGSQEAPPPAGGEGGVSKSKCKAKLVAVVGAVCNCGAVAMRCCRGGGRGTWPRTGEVRIAVAW